MGEAQFIKSRVSPDMKQRVHELAEQQLITESVWLKRLVTAALHETASDRLDLGREVRAARATHRDGVLKAGGDEGATARVYLRLHPDDQLLLRERARARGMRSATYVSVLVRAHLRTLTPLPKDELVALKRSVAELGAIGRNLNQIARAANSGDRATGPAREDLRALLKVCEALRDNVKGLIKANANAWDIGHAESES